MSERKTSMHILQKSLLASSLILTSATAAYAGGIALGATRVIYHTNEKNTVLPILNTSETTRFLIQSWVSDGSNNKVDNFIITPPLFALGPKKENRLRIIYNGPMLPQDRESVFYINSKAIPSVPKESLKGNTLQIATQSVIKLFMRPQGLESNPADAPKSLTCHVANGQVMVKNPSPYYVTLVQFRVGNQKLKNNMVAPKSTLTATIPGHASGSVYFQSINDFGANSAEQHCTG
ncbi:fimbrial biogenesis chaperone [Buttiauxella agrestis]|nr:fimbria/pilus periplasmic chaperone [Buttiauxella agrestis]